MNHLRRPITVTLLLFLSSFVLPHSSFSAQPSVLFIIVDDLTTTLGCYGNPSVRTPGMDAATAGGAFERRFAQRVGDSEMEGLACEEGGHACV